MNKPALSPCPFCGDPMELQHTVIRHTEYVADCPISKMSMDSLYRDRWNRRSPAPAPAETEEDRALANFDKIKDSFFASNDAMLATPAEGVTSLIEASSELIAARTSQFKARNGRMMGIEDDSGEKCWIVPFDAMAALETALAAALPSNEVKP